MSLELFTQGGESLETTIDDSTSSQHSFTLAAGSSLVKRIQAESDVQVGWGVGSGTLPVQIASVYSSFQNGAASLLRTDLAAARLVAEAGIAATGASIRHVLGASFSADGLDTAMAIVNATDAQANLTLTLTDTQQATLATADLVLEPGNQTARFFREFFELGQNGLDLPQGDFAGTFVVEGDTDVSVMSLKTNQGRQTSSLPSGTGSGQ